MKFPRKVNVIIIDKYDWQFEIDVLKTELLYRNRQKSIIDAGRQLPELVNFLSELGIDIEKPDGNNPDLSDVVYSCIGNAKSKTNYEIDMYGREQYISIVVNNNNDTIKLEVFGIR